MYETSENLRLKIFSQKGTSCWNYWISEEIFTGAVYMGILSMFL